MHLGKRALKIEELEEDFKTGINLINLLEVIGAETLGKYNKKPMMKIQCIENINKALKYIASKNVKLWGIGSEDIYDGNRKLTLGMIWTIILRFAIADISEEELNAKEALLLWCKKKTKGYNDVQVENFHKSWKDGLALNALIHAHRPDLLDFDSLNKENAAENLELAFDIAEKELGIPRLLDIEDIVDVPKPDERSVMTYIAQFYHVFSASRKQEVAGRRIGKLVDLNKTMEQMQGDYNVTAEEHMNWVKQATEKMNEREFDNTLEGVQKQVGDHKTFKSEEKPPKVAEKLDIENQMNAINFKLNKAGRSAFVPKDGCSTGEITAAWDELNEAEKNRDAALAEELERQKKLDLLNRRFNNKADQLEKWINKKEDYLNKEDEVDSVDSANRRIKFLDAYNEEYNRTKPKVEDLNTLAKEIEELNFVNKEDVRARADGLTDRFNNLQGLSEKKGERLDNKLKEQQEKERLRLQWAEVTTNYRTWASNKQSEIASTNFPNSLEGCQAYAEKLDASDNETREANDSKKADLDALWAELQEKGVQENRYTVLTNEDVAAIHQSVNDALETRRTEYQEELKRQEVMEEKRKEFAEAAQAFVNHVKARKEEITGLEGEPEPLIQTIRDNYNEGSQEQEKLNGLSALQEEMAGLGIADNKHTKYTLGSLNVTNNKLNKHVQGRISMLEEENNMKNKYNDQAQVLQNWITETTPTIQADDFKSGFDNTLEGVRKVKTEWNYFKTTQKAQRGIAKINLTNLFNKIQKNQEANNRPAFVPEDNLSQDNINQNFEQLENDSKSRDQAIREELERQEKLASLVKSFNGNAEELEAWASEKQEYLDTKETVDSLDDARLKTMYLDVYDEDFQNTLKNVENLKQQQSEIAALNYNDIDTINSRVETINALWSSLQDKSNSKRTDLDSDNEREQNKENLRVDFATQINDYVKWVKDTVHNIETSHNFGHNLNDVTNYKETLDQENEATTNDSNSKLDSIKQAQQALADNDVNDNVHTELTVADAEASHQSVVDALAARNAAYDTELQTQTENDAQRKAFAELADEFVNFLNDQFSQAEASEGSTDERTEAVKAIYADGAPSQEKYDNIVKFNDENRQRGIFTNEYTDHSTISLNKRLTQYNEKISNLLSAISEEAEMNERRAQKEAEWQQKAALQQQRIEWNDKVSQLDQALDNIHEECNEPISVSNIEQAQSLVDEANSLNEQYSGQSENFNSIVSEAGNLKEAGEDVSEEESSISDKFNSTKDTVSTRQEQVNQELETQTANDALCKNFADNANTLQEFINTTNASINNVDGELEDQIAQLQTINSEINNNKAQLSELENLNNQIEEAQISSNSHTDLTFAQLNALFSQLQKHVSDQESIVSKEIASQKHSTASPEQIEEFKEVFRHFDKNNNSYLSPLEFKSCLQSLGEDPTDDDMEKLLNQLGKEVNDVKTVDFDSFVEYMINVASDSTSESEILQSFRDISGDKEFVEEADLRRYMPGDQVDYLIANMPLYKDQEGKYDFAAFCSQSFSN
eukprot:TRINITY_DN85_c0_g1_i2.p1 TRINITY_DN85_c0_g1~~TRINITY_DN85_c0_g1_i2.p1  ORF type:complete len:1520 (-),score=772.40 TRINITY_DN85_c0_g1_i2:137-4696(-)